MLKKANSKKKAASPNAKTPAKNTAKKAASAKPKAALTGSKKAAKSKPVATKSKKAVTTKGKVLAKKAAKAAPVKSKAKAVKSAKRPAAKQVKKAAAVKKVVAKKAAPKKSRQVVKAVEIQPALTHGTDQHFIPVRNQQLPLTTHDGKKIEQMFHSHEEVALHQENAKVKANMASRMGQKRIFKMLGR